MWECGFGVVFKGPATDRAAGWLCIEHLFVLSCFCAKSLPLCVTKESSPKRTEKPRGYARTIQTLFIDPLSQQRHIITDFLV